MEVVGRTIDGRLAVAKIARLYFEHGIPLSVVFEGLKMDNMVPSWPHLVAELQENGLTSERISHLLHEHVFEAYGAEVRDHVLRRLGL
jgi:hypothetical protein